MCAICARPPISNEFLSLSLTFRVLRVYTVPPKINYLVPSTKLEVAKGASIKLECKASGNPTPTIIWSRKVSASRVTVDNIHYILQIITVISRIAATPDIA